MLKSMTDFRNKKWKIGKEFGKFHVFRVGFRIAWSSFGGFLNLVLSFQFPVHFLCAQLVSSISKRT